MEYFALIDTETTWSGVIMTVGVLIVKSDTFDVVDYRYYIVNESLREGGMFDYIVHMKGIEEETISIKKIEIAIREYLAEKKVTSIFAYNAGFDKKCLSQLNSYHWHDIMRLAAYRQYNSAIPDTAQCCKTGRLKSGYGVENIMRMFGKRNYVETHNALIDARDELEIMRLLGYSIDLYPRI